MQAGRVRDQMREWAVGCLAGHRIPPHRPFGVPRIDHEDTVARLDNRAAVRVVLRQPGSRIAGVESDRYRCRGPRPERIDEVVQLTETVRGIAMSERLPVRAEPVADAIDHSPFRAAVVDTPVGKPVQVARMRDLRVTVERRQPGHDVVAAGVPAAGDFGATIVDQSAGLMCARIEPGRVTVALT